MPRRVTEMRGKCYNARMSKANPPARKTPAPVDLNEVRELLAENTKAIVELRKANAEARAEHDREAAEARKRQAKIDEQLAALGKSVDAVRDFVWDAIREVNAQTAKQLAVHDKEMSEIRKTQAQTEKLLADLGIRADKALAVAEKNNKYIGDHSRNEGELLEMECYNTLAKAKQINGIKLDGFHLGGKDPEHAVEVDIVGYNGKVTMLIEVKRTLSADDVRRFAEVRVGRFKKAFPQYSVDKDVIPVIIFAMPRTGEDADAKDPVELALELGLIVMQSIGENQLSHITDPGQVVSRATKGV